MVRIKTTFSIFVVCTTKIKNYQQKEAIKPVYFRTKQPFYSPLSMYLKSKTQEEKQYKYREPT